MHGWWHEPLRSAGQQSALLLLLLLLSVQTMGRTACSRALTRAGDLTNMANTLPDETVMEDR